MKGESDPVTRSDGKDLVQGIREEEGPVQLSRLSFVPVMLHLTVIMANREDASFVVERQGNEESPDVVVTLAEIPYILSLARNNCRGPVGLGKTPALPLVYRDDPKRSHPRHRC